VCLHPRYKPLLKATANANYKLLSTTLNHMNGETKPIVLIVLGIILILSGLWGGAYLLHIFPVSSDFCFPSYMTAWLMCIGGLILCVRAISKYID